MTNPSVAKENAAKIAATLADPLQFIALCWPTMKLYAKQREIIRSVCENIETFVYAANKTGKTRVAALVAIWFLASRSPARIVISSSSEHQLRNVLWREICHLIRTSALPLPFKISDLRILKQRPGRTRENYSEDYLIASATNTAESFQGYHLPGDIPRELAILDEASGIPDEIYEAAVSWASRVLVIGNPLQNTNFFYLKCNEGNVCDPVNPKHLMRNVIHIGGLDVPNVALGFKRGQSGLPGVTEALIDGLLTHADYVRNGVRWRFDERARTIRLDGRFYEGADVLLFPSQFLDRAFDESRWEELSRSDRKALAMGIDIAANGPSLSCWTIADQSGIIEQKTLDTPDTMQIVGETIRLMNKHGLSAWAVAMDVGGLGKPVADRLAEKGYRILKVHFGESSDDKQSYPNRRAELYAKLAELLDPGRPRGVFALPPDAIELRQELAVIPRILDSEGRLAIPPKRAKLSGQPSLIKMMRRSPDRTDSLALVALILSRLDAFDSSDDELIIWPTKDSGGCDPGYKRNMSSLERALYENGLLECLTDLPHDTFDDY